MLCNRFDITNQIPRGIQDHCEELDLLKPGYRGSDRKDTPLNKLGFEFPPSESICWHKSLAIVRIFGLLVPFFLLKQYFLNLHVCCVYMYLGTHGYCN